MSQNRFVSPLSSEKLFVVGTIPPGPNSSYFHLQRLLVSHDGIALDGELLPLTGQLALSGCAGIAVDAVGDLVFASQDLTASSSAISVYSKSTGSCLRSFGFKGRKNGEFTELRAIATAADKLFVLDQSGRIQVFM